MSVLNRIPSSIVESQPSIYYFLSIRPNVNTLLGRKCGIEKKGLELVLTKYIECSIITG